MEAAHLRAVAADRGLKLLKGNHVAYSLFLVIEYISNNIEDAFITKGEQKKLTIDKIWVAPMVP